MFERFTDKALKAILRSQGEARRLRRNFVGTEFILVGLVGETTGIAGECLHEAGVSLKNVQSAVDEVVGKGSDTVGEIIPFMPGTKRLLELAWQEAKYLHGDPTKSESLVPVGTQHLLLALTKMEDRRVEELFNRLHINKVRLKEKVIQAIEKNLLKNETTVASLENNSSKPDSSESIFAKFTYKAIKVVEHAQKEAHLMGHNFIGSEQLLLGLIAEDTDIGAAVLKKMGFNLTTTRIEVEKIIGKGSGFVGVDTPFSTSGKNVIEMLLTEANGLGSNYIGTEHIFLSLISQKDGVATRIFAKFGYDHAMLVEYRKKFIKFLAKSKSEGEGKAVV